MNAKLHEQVEKAIERNKSVFYQDGNFTICLLLNNKRVISVGVAKRNPNCDDDLPERGREISLARAVKNSQVKKEKKKAKQSRL